MGRFASRNPARPDDVIAEFQESSAADVDEAISRAEAAQREWAKVPVPERAERIAGVAAVLADRKEQLAQLVAREAGKVLIEARGDVQEAIDMGWYIAGQGRLPSGDFVPSELPNKMCWTTRQPVGVIAMITPWNFPVAIPSWKCFPALLAGNAMVLKPSEHAPKCADAFVEACVEGGIPAGLIQVVHGFAEPAQALVDHPRVQAVSFTGSVPTGRKVAAAAMANGPRLVSLELGGKNAMVVMADADLELVLEGALFGAFGTAGQRCTSTSRLLVHRSIAADVVKRLAERAQQLVIGDPAKEGTDVGPVIDATALDRIDSMVTRAVDEGATVVLGGKRVSVDDCPEGTFYAPTILAGVAPGSYIATTEVFGPVLSVIEFDTAEEAVEIVNEAAYGLSAAVYTKDVSAAFRMVDAINTGIVYVNAPTIGAEIQLPFGGTKHTGNGFREAGQRGIEQFSEVKTVYVDYSGRLQRAQIDNRIEQGIAEGDM